MEVINMGIDVDALELLPAAEVDGLLPCSDTCHGKTCGYTCSLTCAETK
jgi:hypothetical protein